MFISANIASIFITLSLLLTVSELSNLRWNIFCHQIYIMKCIKNFKWKSLCYSRKIVYEHTNACTVYLTSPEMLKHAIWKNTPFLYTRCASYVGRIGRRQEIFLGPRCWFKGTVVHEIGKYIFILRQRPQKGGNLPEFNYRSVVKFYP